MRAEGQFYPYYFEIFINIQTEEDGRETIGHTSLQKRGASWESTFPSRQQVNDTETHEPG